MEQGYIYLDNASTTFPKPECVHEAVLKTMREEGGNPGRSGHSLSLAAGKVVQEARLLCARLFHAQSPDSIVFTYNTTMALNMAIKGAVKPGDHVITSSLEHNSVSRPLRNLEQAGVEVTKLRTDVYHGLDADDVKNAIRHNTRLVVCTHISNVAGTINDIASIGACCREHGVLLLVDAAQSAGTKPIDVQGMYIDMLAFPGHKGLLGPQGTGGLYIEPELEIDTILQGGTGSESESLFQPESMPERFESGTLNTPGLAGLAAGIRYILEQGIAEIGRREDELTNRLIEGISRIDGIRLIGPGPGTSRGSVVSVCFDKMPPAEAAQMMDAAFHIAVRGGYHCSVDGHRSAGTLESGGTLRISPNCMNSPEDIDRCIAALSECAKGK
jgi:cysteine desulfurase family protein